MQFSAQLARSAGSGTEDVLIWLRKNGSDLSWTNTDVTLAGSTNVKQVAAWNWFISAAANDYFELMWSTTSTNIVIEANATPTPNVPSVILTVNRIDQFLSNTGSFSGSFTGQLIGTSSYATKAGSAATLDLYGITANSSSYLLFSNTVAATGQTVGGNNNLRYNSSTNVLTVGNISATTLTGSLYGTASYTSQALSSSFALTASKATAAGSAPYVCLIILTFNLLA